MPQGFARLRPLLLLVGVALPLIMTLPPIGSYARQDEVAQAFQFVVFAAAAPTLLVLGWPARLIRAGRSVPPARHELRIPAGLALRPAVRAWAALLPSLAAVVVWRLPVVLAALRHDPALTMAELITLVAAGFALWAESTIWALAYITGMSTTGLASAQSAVPDHQLAVGVMWAVPAACYVPVIFATMMSWLDYRKEPAEEAVGLLADPAWPDAAGRLQPPRGWR